MSTSTVPEIQKPVKIKILLHDRGPALWPERFDEPKLLAIKKQLGTYYFGSLYGGTPAPEGGGCFQRSWFQYWGDGGEYYLLSRNDGSGRRPVRKDFTRRFVCVDLAFSTKTENDYTVIMAFAVTPDADLLVLDIHRERMTGEKLTPAIRNMMERNGADYAGIEDVQAQMLVVQTARKHGLVVRALKANIDKLTRSVPAQIRMEAGQIFFPSRHPDLEAFEHELLTFPKGAHDDMVDCLCYGVLEVQRFGPAAIPPEERERIEKERLEREWQAKLARDRAAQQDMDAERWWSNYDWN